jgi:hypothetical protein
MVIVLGLIATAALTLAQERGSPGPGQRRPGSRSEDGAQFTSQPLAKSDAEKRVLEVLADMNASFRP